MTKILNHTIFHLILILITIGLVYHNIFPNQFVWDDYSFILGWPELTNFVQHIPDFFAGQVPEGHEGLYRPLRSVWYGIAFSFFGTQAQGYHWLSLAILLASCILLYFLINQLTQKPLLGLATSILFAAHPVHVEAITWLTPNFDIIGVVFGVASIYSFIKFRIDSSLPWFILAVFLATLAYFTNEITLVLPGIAAWYDLCFGSEKSWIKTIKRNFKYWLGIFGPSLIYLYIRFFGLNIGAREPYLYYSAYLTGLLMSVAAVKHILVLLWPTVLTVNHVILPGYTALFYHEYNPAQILPIPSLSNPLIVGSLIILGILGYSLVKYRKRYPLLAFFGGWHFLGVLPLMQIVPQSIIFGERYLYLASFGSLSFLVLGLFTLFKKQKVKNHQLMTLAIVGLISLPLGYRSYLRNFDWRDSRSLWQSTLDVGPRTPYALSNLAKEYYESGDTDTALELLEESYQINPHHILAVSNLGWLYAVKGDYDKALELLLRIHEEAPGSTQAIEKIGGVYLRKKEYHNAIHWYSLYRDSRPDDPIAQLKLASAFHTSFIFNRAEVEYQQALAMNPDDPLIYWQLAELYSWWGRDEEAEQMRQQMKALDPSFSKESSITVLEQTLE